jgi:hypothetical protein
MCRADDALVGGDETPNCSRQKLNLKKKENMSVNPQFTYDNAGNPVGVFLSIDDWNKITQEFDI